MILPEQKYAPVQQQNPTPPLGRSKKHQSLRIWLFTFLPLLAHFFLVVGTAAFVIYKVDGKKFGIPGQGYDFWTSLHDQSTSTSGHPAFTQSDVTTTLSALIVTIRILVGLWLGDVVWKLMFILLEKTGLSIPEINHILTWKCPPPRAYKRESWRYTLTAALILLLHLPAQLSAPVLSGALNWKPAFQAFPGGQILKVPSFIADSSGWSRYQGSSDGRSAVVSDAVRKYDFAWYADPDASEYQVRRDLNRVTSTSTRRPSFIRNVTLPYISLASLEWVEDPQNIPAEQLNAVHSYYPLLNISEATNPILYFPTIGNVALIPPAPWSPQPVLNPSLNLSPTAAAYDAPPSRLYSRDRAYIAVLGRTSPVGTPCNSTRTSPFFGEIPPKAGWYEYHAFQEWYTCFIFAAVNVVAGVSTCQNCQLEAGRVVTHTFGHPKDVVIEPDVLFYEALSLSPRITVGLAMKNASLPLAYGNLEGYVKKLVKRGYAAAWCTLTDYTFGVGSLENTGLTSEASEAVSVLEADVSRIRVGVWVALHALVWIAALMFAVVQSSSRPMTGNTPLMLMFLDKSKMDPGKLSRLGNEREVGKEHEELGTLELVKESDSLDNQWYLVEKSRYGRGTADVNAFLTRRNAEKGWVST